MRYPTPDSLQQRAAKLSRKAAFDALMSEAQAKPLNAEEYTRFQSILMRKVISGAITPAESNKLVRAVRVKL